MFPDDADHHISSPPINTTHNLVINPQQSSIQEKAKKLMAKAKQNKRKSIFKQAIEQKFKEYDHKLEALTSINIPEAIEEVVQAKVLTEMKKQLPTHVPTAIAKFVKPRLNNTVLEVMKNNQINLFTTPSPTTTDDLSEMDLKLKLLNKMYKSKSFESHDTHHKLYDLLYESICLDQETLDAQDTEPSFKKRPHDHQDPPNDREGEKRKKRRKDAGEPSSRSSKKDKALMDHVHEDTPADQPQDQKEELAKRLKELIKKDELTIADLEGVGLKMLKRQYKNDVELEYHVEQLKTTVLEEAQWCNGECDVSKPRSFDKQMFKSTKPHNCFYNRDYYYLVNLSTEEKYTSSLTKHFAARYHIEGIEDMIPDRWSKKIHLYQIDALNGIHHWDDARKDFFKAEMGNRSSDKVYSDKRIIFVVKVNVKKKWGYGFLTSIVVRRSDNKEYEFSYVNLPRLNLNDVEDMYLLKVQDKLHHLKLDFEIDFINALNLFIRRAFIQNRIKDVQLGVESYQRTLNLTKPKFYFLGIDKKIPYTTSGTEKGVNLMKMVNENILGHGNKSLKGRDWNGKDIKRSNEMLEKIDKTLKRKEQLRRLEEYVGGRPKTFDPRTFVRP
ncbi:hypothetical protein Tco_0604846 [Tanacetum coccineum]